MSAATTSAPESTHQSDYVSGTIAKKMIGTTQGYKLLRAALIHGIRIKQFDGANLLFCREDVARVGELLRREQE